MKHTIYILWDASHIWGLMAWHTMTTMGVPCRLIKAQNIPYALLSGKSPTSRPAMLLVPGGTASLKSHALGAEGRAAIRQYVAEGGQYLGFCGGAGLALADATGLHLCPWTRATYTDRMQHLVSGHVLSSIAKHSLVPLSQEHKTQSMLPLPVWWPGRFAAQQADAVTILATYEKPCEDLLLADISLASLPAHTLSHWQDVYGVNLRADFLTGQPCVITGRYGKGRYVLSYAHLETPHSLDANAWLAHLLHTMGRVTPVQRYSASWDIDSLPVRWPASYKLLHEARQGVQHCMVLGTEQHLLFRRTPWLYGWRTGIPGAALNNLHTSLCTVLSLEPNTAALQFWKEKEARIKHILPHFLEGVEGYLLAERLATTLAIPLPHIMDRNILKTQRENIFGKPMHGGGLYQELLDIVDELFFLALC